MTDFLYALGRACARHPRRTAGAWLLVVAALAVLAGTAGGELRDRITVPGTSSDRAQSRLASAFPAEEGAEAHVVARWPDRTDPAATERVRAAVTTLPGVRTAAVRTAADGRTVLIVVRYTTTTAGVVPRDATDALTAAARPLRAAGAEVAVGGEVPEGIQGPNGTAEAAGVVVALLVLLFAFGSAVAAGLPLLIAAVSLGAGLSLITLLAAVADVNTVSPTLGSMIGLGVGIDYALFVVARARERLAAGATPVEAAAASTATAGRSVVFAGGTVLIALCGLLFGGVASFASMGVAAALVVAVTVAASVTLLPALLAACGTRVFGRRARAAPATRAALRSPRAERWAETVARRPVLWLVSSVLALLALAAPVTGLRLGQGDAGSERPANPTRQAYDLVEAAFGPGANGPLAVVVDAADAGGVRARVAALPGVAAITETSLSPDGSTAVFSAVPASRPQAAETQDLVRRLRSVLPPGAGVTGPTAAVVDLTDALAGHLWRVLAAVLLATFLLLVAVFRSVVLPAKAVLVNLLTVSAAYGVLTLAFQTASGASLLGLDGPVPIPAWAPMVLFCVLFGLSMDYEVFLVARVRERYDRTGDTRRAVITGLGDTARIVTSAGAVMVAVAFGFALDPGVAVKIIGVGLATAVLLDITIARLVLVPAALMLFGDRNWYLPAFLGGRRGDRHALAG